MKQSLIVVEGPDDLAALRELLDRRFGGQKKGQVATREHSFVWRDLETRIIMSNGKDHMPELVHQRIRDLPTALFQFTQMGICFDPDRHSDAQILQWLGSVSGASAAWDKDGGCPVSIGDRAVDVIALPWDIGPIFDDLEDFRNLERVALAVLAKSDTSEGALIEELLKKVQSAGKKVSWKTAFRLWAAIRYADKDPDTGGAMAHVFGQDEAVRTALDSVLCNSVLLSRLKKFAGTAAA